MRYTKSQKTIFTILLSIIVIGFLIVIVGPFVDKYIMDNNENTVHELQYPAKFKYHKHEYLLFNINGHPHLVHSPECKECYNMFD